MPTILIDKNVWVPMRDGVRLATDVYRLDGSAPTPVLVTRTPCDKERTLAGGGGFDVLRAVQAGYAVVIQDVRGRYASEGEFNPFFQEASDGADAIAWAAAQPWSNGVVGTFGPSYLGVTQWLAAREQPPALRAMASAVAPSDAYEGMAYQGGAPVFHTRRWAAVMTTEEIRRRAARGAAAGAGEPPPDVEAILAHLPLARTMILTEGILRARYRKSTSEPELLEPDAIYELRLDLWATANVFLPGHRIRLEVSSSNFPRFDRNCSTGGEIARQPASEYRPAINRVFHDAAHPSRLILPIVER